MDTRQAQPAPPDLRPQKTKRPVWQLVAAGFAGLLAVVGITAGIFAIADGDETANGLEVVADMQAAVAAGDPAGLRAAYHPDATFEWIGREGSADGITGSLSDPYGRFPAVFAFSDWDGDGTISVLDALTTNEMMQYANGRDSSLATCTQPAADTVVCRQPSGGAFFEIDVYGATWTYTVADGQITHVAFSFVEDGSGEGGSGQVRARAAEFETWLNDNHPELNDVLFIPGTASGAAWLKPDNLEMFRSTVAEWVASR